MEAQTTKRLLLHIQQYCMHNLLSQKYCVSNSATTSAQQQNSEKSFNLQYASLHLPKLQYKNQSVGTGYHCCNSLSKFTVTVHTAEIKYHELSMELHQSCADLALPSCHPVNVNEKNSIESIYCSLPQYLKCYTLHHLTWQEQFQQ